MALPVCTSLSNDIILMFFAYVYVEQPVCSDNIATAERIIMGKFDLDFTRHLLFLTDSMQ